MILKQGFFYLFHVFKGIDLLFLYYLDPANIDYPVQCLRKFHPVSNPVTCAHFKLTSKPFKNLIFGNPNPIPSAPPKTFERLITVTHKIEWLEKPPVPYPPPPPKRGQTSPPKRTAE